MGHHTFQGALAVRFQQGLRGHRFGIEQPIGGFGFVPTAAGGRDRLFGMAGKRLDQRAGATVQAGIAQVEIGKLLA